MTKHKILVLVFLVALTSFAMGQAYEHCDTKALKDTCKAYLDRPYKYDASNVILISFQKKAQLKEIELPMFIGETYKILFNTYALPPGVEINVYNKDADHEGRKMLFSCNSSGAQKVFIYETEHWHSKLYIDYVIPAAHGDNGATDNTGGSPDIQGCGVLVIGYK
ncbi:MAG TPA: hypothetical protein VK806_09455 [Bacteroidia bacterium]|jgi:hypothetical protein|nr:hypothetical protein [Bacteroidia bacterium]